MTTLNLPPASSSSGAQPPADRLALLYHLSQDFNSSLDLDEVLNRVMDEVIVAVRAERGFVMLFDAQGQLGFRVARGMDQHTIQDPVFQVSLSVVEGVARQGQPVITGDAQIDPRFSMRQSVKMLGLRSILCVPLRIKERILGTIYVDNRVQAGMFTPADLELLNAIASSAAVAIENARLYQVAVEKARTETELQMARQVQASLMPEHIPQVPGWEFIARWLPARQVSGDYYDFFDRQGKQPGFVIADVSDKGMPAALFMALSRSIVRASLLDATQTPSEGIRRANRLIQADSTSGMFVTLFYAALNSVDGQLTYVNAGHNPPMLYRRQAPSGGEGLSYLERTGMALGVDPDVSYEQRTISMTKGDFLVCYTDGVTDALNPQGQDFGLQRLEQAVWANRQYSTIGIVAGVERAIQEFTGDAPRFDDITLLIARRTA
jgi:phosphoserine phosphatase RsbU/P